MKARLKPADHTSPQGYSIQLLINFILVSLFSIAFQAQAQELEWLRTYGGNSHDKATAMVVDSEGNVYVTGFSYASKPTDYTETLKDIATIKYNSTGEQQWVMRYNGPANAADHAVDIALDASGNVYVTGYSAGSEGDDSDSRSAYDYVTIKYSTNGEEQWVARYDGPGNGWDEATALEVDAAGNVYVTGFVYVAGEDISAYYDIDYATIKYNTDGEQQWVKRYNGSSNLRDIARALVLDEAGNIYVTGSSLIENSTFGENSATIKYDTNGNELWIAKYGAPEDIPNFYARDLALDDDGNVYVTGYSWSEFDSDGLAMFDYTTVKYNSEGALQWVRFYDSSELVFDNVNDWRDDFARALAVDAEGNVYVTGQTGNREEDPDNAILTIKYSTLGDELWVALYDGPGGPQGGGGNDIALDAEGNVYVTGSVTMTQEWQNLDYVTIKYSPEGVQQWLLTYNGTGNYIDDATAIALDDLGNVYMTGQSYLDDESVGYLDMESVYATIKYLQTSCTPPTPSIAVVSTSDVYTGGEARTLYLGYGPQSVQLVASGAESYAWSPADGLSDASIADPVFTPTASGSYTFTVTAYEGACSTTASVIITVIDARCGNGKVLLCHKGETNCISPSSVEAHLRNHPEDRLGSCGESGVMATSMRVYPNPLSDRAKVELSVPKGQAYSLELYNADGRRMGVIADGQGSGSVQLEMRAEKLRKGVYYLRLITNDEAQTLRLLINK